MYEDNNIILKRYPRYDTDFTFRNPSLNWETSGDSFSWVYTVVVLLWIVGGVALILYACAQSSKCPCYDCLYKLRRQPYRPQPNTEYGEDWASPHVLVGEEVAHRALIPPSPPPLQNAQGQKRFEDPPPAYSEVMRADLPAYPTDYPQCNAAQISVIIPDREWTNRTREDGI